jgi:HAD superfamily hydrolase (TIGR01509 family)
MSRPKAAIFDLGKVLVDFDYSIAGRRIAARGGTQPEAVRRFIDHSPLLFRFETGRINREEFFAEVRAATGFAGTLEEFSGYFADIFTPIEPMVEFQQRLRGGGVPTFIFSNTNELAIGHIRRNFPFFAHFDGYILSYEHGAMKPDPALYEVVESVSGCRAAELFYIDDRPENIATARDRGWQGVVHQDPARTMQAWESAVSLESHSGPQKR